MPDLLDDSVVKSIAKKYGKSVAQVLLRFTIERGIAVIPKSTNSKRILENFSIFDFELNQDDFELLSRLNQGPVARICDFNFMKGSVYYFFKKTVQLLRHCVLGLFRAIYLNLFFY